MAGKGCAFLLLMAFLLAGGCGKNPDASADKNIVVTVNGYSISRDEFEDEFKASSYGQIDTPESRRNFANTLVDRKLMLQYAQKEGLDKEKNFLKTIEKFWEQSLLKIALDQKTREVQATITAAGWQAKRAEEALRMSEWMGELRRNASVTQNAGISGNPVDQGRSR